MSGKQVLNRSAALARMAGDESLYADMVRFYLEDSPPLLEQLERSLELGQTDEVERSAHALRGLILNCGGDLVAECAQQVESAAHQGNLDLAGRAHEQFKVEIERFRQSLESLSQIENQMPQPRRG